MLSRSIVRFCKEIRGVSDYYDKIGFDSRVDHLYDSGICLIGLQQDLGTALVFLAILRA